MNSSFKVIIIVLAVGALSAGAYFSLGNTAEGQAEPLLKSSVTNNAVGIPDGNVTTDQQVQEVLIKINDLDQIKLNTAIFDSPEFLALRDISKDLPEPRDVGRPNPFAPIGVDVGNVPSDGSVPGSAASNFPDANLAVAASALKTKEVQNIGQRSATFNADVSIKTSTNRWFEWGPNPSTVNKTTRQTGTEAVFSATQPGLLPNTIYFVKAVIEDNGVITYGEIVSFKTAQ